MDTVVPTVAPSPAVSQEEESSDTPALLELPTASLIVDLPLESDSMDSLVDSLEDSLVAALVDSLEDSLDSDLQVPVDSISLVDFKV